MVYGEPRGFGLFDWLLSSSIGGDFYMGLSDFHPPNAQPHDVLFTREGEQHVRRDRR
jgi:hypothetical protein